MKQKDNLTITNLHKLTITNLMKIMNAPVLGEPITHISQRADSIRFTTPRFSLTLSRMPIVESDTLWYAVGIAVVHGKQAYTTVSYESLCDIDKFIKCINVSFRDNL